MSRFREREFAAAMETVSRRPSAVLLSIIGLLAGCGNEPEDPSAVDVQAALGDSDTSGYERAYAPRSFQFPQDHGPHPNFRNEWWYVTGNLIAENDRRFGYQLTLFRIAVSPNDPPTDSPWRTRQVYMGHFALTDVERGEHRAFERFARGAVGLAGARGQPFRVWLEDWELAGSGDATFPMSLRAQEEGIGLALTLENERNPVLQGDRGLSRKSGEPGNASYYYSYTRLPTFGRITLGNDILNVVGSSWLDREWSTSALGAEQTGWDWFALQLDDGRDLMFYRLRRRGGGTDRHSQGVLVGPDGTTRHLDHEDVLLEPLEFWTSPETGDRYPSAWRLTIPAESLVLRVTAVVDDQEMTLTVRYWEGAVDVEGDATGQGYLEMTRYESDIRSAGDPTRVRPGAKTTPATPPIVSAPPRINFQVKTSPQKRTPNITAMTGVRSMADEIMPTGYRVSRK